MFCPSFTRFTASVLNSVVYSCFGIFNIAFLPFGRVYTRPHGRRNSGGTSRLHVWEAYMAEYGALEIDGRAFAGLTSKEIKFVGDIVQFTKHAREKYGLSEQYLALDFQDGNAFLC